MGSSAVITFPFTVQGYTLPDVFRMTAERSLAFPFTVMVTFVVSP